MCRLFGVTSPPRDVTSKGVSVKKLCPRCGEEKELTEDNFYPARPRKNHKKPGWQSYCRLCWRDINKSNKNRIRQAGWTTVEFVAGALVLIFVVLLIVSAIEIDQSFRDRCAQAGGTPLSLGRGNHLCVSEDSKILPVSYYK